LHNPLPNDHKYQHINYLRKLKTIVTECSDFCKSGRPNQTTLHHPAVGCSHRRISALRPLVAADPRSFNRSSHGRVREDTASYTVAVVRASARKRSKANRWPQVGQYLSFVHCGFSSSRTKASSRSGRTPLGRPKYVGSYDEKSTWQKLHRTISTPKAGASAYVCRPQRGAPVPWGRVRSRSMEQRHESQAGRSRSGSGIRP
jgi:hypothetical protein